MILNDLGRFMVNMELVDDLEEGHEQIFSLTSESQEIGQNDVQGRRLSLSLLVAQDVVVGKEIQRRHTYLTSDLWKRRESQIGFKNNAKNEK